MREHLWCQVQSGSLPQRGDGIPQSCGIRGVLLIAGFLAAATLPCFAIDTQIGGRVADSQDLAIQGAVVRVVDQATGIERRSITNAEGLYEIPFLLPGTYQVFVQASGFSTAASPALALDLGQVLWYSVQLRIGIVSQTVQVDGAPRLMQTQEASVGQAVPTGTIADTPLNGRNYVYIAQLTMGVMPGTQGSRGEQKGDFSVNGQRPEQNNFILDGIDNNANLADFLNGASFVIKPPPDALQEFSVQTSNYSAELGHSSGGVLNASIKSGTNVFHGSLWEYFRNDSLNAIDWFSMGKPEYRQNQFGATLGGPVVKNKLFLFGDAEANRIVFQETSNYFSVPTLLMRSSGFTNFTELLNSASTGNSKVQNLFRPGGPAVSKTATNLLACNGVPNTLCPSQVNPVAAAILRQYPLANTGAVGQTYNNYLFQGKVTDNTTQYDVRADWNIRTADQIFARYSYSQEPQYYPSPLGPVLDGGSFSADGNVAVEGRNFASSEVHVFAPNLVNELRAGYTYLHAYFLQENSGTNLAPSYGLGGIPSNPGSSNGGLPGLSITGLSRAGSPTFFPANEYQNVTQLLDNLTTTVRTHSIKLGVSFQLIRYSTLQPLNPRGSESFTGKYSDDPASTDNSGSGIVDFVQDYMQSASINNIYTTDDRRWYDSFYLQDDWKTNRKLTLNLGIRYEYVQPGIERNGHQANFVPGPYTAAGTAAAPGYRTVSGTYLIPEQSANYLLAPIFVQNLAANHIAVQYTHNSSLMNAQKLNVSPRIGFAYSPDSKLMIRGGLGIFFGGLENLGYGPNIGNNPPFAIADSLSPQTCSSPTSCTFLGGVSSVSAPGAAILETGFTGLLGSNGALSPTGLVDPSVRSYAVSNKTAYTEGYNLSVQRQVGKTMAATIAYVGNVDRHLRVLSSTDSYDGLLPPGTSYNSYLPLGGSVPGDAANYAAYGLSGGSIIADTGIGNYNALQAKLEKSSSRDLTFLATYTWSHALDDARPPLNNYAGQAAYRLPQWLGIRYDYGSDLQDVRRRATLNAHYTLPFGKGHSYLNTSGVRNGIIGGWESSMTFRVQTGNPVELIGNNTLGNGNSYPYQVANPFARGGTPNANTSSVTQCATNTRQAGIGSHWWFNPCAFSNPNAVTATNYNTEPLSYFYGHQDATNVVGPGYNRIDIALFKNFALIGESHLQFRTEIFNLFNTPAHGQPATNPGGGGGAESNQLQANQAFGQIESERFHGEQPDSRVIQFSMKYQF